MSIAAQCSDCCECHQPTVEWDSRSASKSKCGWTSLDGSSPNKRWLTKTISGEVLSLCCGGGGTPLGFEYDGAAVYSLSNSCSSLTSDTRTRAPFGAFNTPPDACGDPVVFGTPSAYTSTIVETDGENWGPGSEVYNFSIVITETTKTITGPELCSPVTNQIRSGTATEVLSDEVTAAVLRTATIAALPAYDNDWDDTAGSYANLSSDELSLSIRESRYRLRFKIPKTNTGLNYRAFWVERFIAEAGVGITSVEVRSPGVYRPTVTLSAPPAGGTQARAVAVMSSTGTVSSIRILNPGSGYTSAPTVTVQAATGGGTSSTGWTATLSGGTVSAITGGSAGDYLPTLAFSSGGGSGATATCAMDSQGGIASVSLGAAGSGYTSEPTLTITAKVSGSTAADLLLHLGTETARCAVWDGVTPGGYDPATPSTYPIIGDGTNPYWSLAVPSSDGTTLVANLRAVCDGSSC